MKQASHGIIEGDLIHSLASVFLERASKYAGVGLSRYLLLSIVETFTTQGFLQNIKRDVYTNQEIISWLGCLLGLKRWLSCCCYRLKLTASQKNDLRNKMADDLMLNKSEKLLQTCVKKRKLAVRCIICNEECSDDFHI